MQWLPDGQTLAFIGAQGKSTSADLYIYSAATKKVTQLSSGASQAISPSW
jgi:Tol biopolymer transport system component